MNAGGPNGHDQPSYELVLPFIVCRSKGGPYEDIAFVAGFQVGEIDRTLATTEQSEVRIEFVYTALIPQLELIAMNRGYPIVEHHPADDAPGWSQVTFRRTTDFSVLEPAQ